jgi:very-short-patch-repair endonuclease
MPVGAFIADFMCREAGLIVEVDGGQHNLRSAEDRQRTALLELEGFRVLRFWNNEVLENAEGVLGTILQALGACPPPTPPASGRGGDLTLSLEREGES